MHKKSFYTLMVSVLSFVSAIVVSGIIMAICGYNPFIAYSIIFKGSVSSFRSFSNSLVQATPLVMTGLAYMVAKKATMINLGVEGQLYIGALVAGIVGMTDFHLPFFLHLSITLVCAMAIAGLCGLFIGYLKVQFGSNEVITTTMTNFILINFTSYLANYPLKAEGASAQTNPVLSSALLPRMIKGYQLSWAIVIAILCAFLVKILMDRTKVGLEIKCVGLNIAASKTAGISVKRVMLLAMFISGALAGLAGALQVVSVNRRFIAGFSPGYGFSGISVAALANDSALGIVLSGFIFGALKNGANYLNMSSRIPTEFVSVVQAFVVIFVSAPLLMKDIFPFLRKGGDQ
ncbi:MAG: ABC transporter permease [Spirochaetaceae bacterium]|nr:ABC transporter permease [Spirochaetaceae bacterium]